MKTVVPNVDFPCEVCTLTIPARLPYADVASAYVEAVAKHSGFAAACMPEC